MASRRGHRPQRSDGEAARDAASAAERRYRFKSYLEANTQEQERFDAMRDSLPNKIDEVMASFRDDKLTVHQHEESSDDDEIRAPKRRQWWPWAVAAAFVVLIGGVLLIQTSRDRASESDSIFNPVPPPSPPPAPLAVTPAPKALPLPPARPVAPVLSPTTPERPVVMVSPPPTPKAVIPTVATSTATHTASALRHPTPHLAAARHSKLATAKHHDAAQSTAAPAQPDHYSEDLTGLLKH